MLESISRPLPPHTAALKIHISYTKDSFLENMREKRSLLGLIALILRYSKLRNKFQLGNTVILQKQRFHMRISVCLCLVISSARDFAPFTYRRVTCV